MMPDQSCRCVTDLQAGVEKPPANVHIVSGEPKLLIKSAESQQHIAFERHVAPGNMLRFAVVDHDMAWIAWANRDASSDPVVGRGGDIGAANRVRLLLDHAADQIGEP